MGHFPLVDPEVLEDQFLPRGFVGLPLVVVAEGERHRHGQALAAGHVHRHRQQRRRVAATGERDQAGRPLQALQDDLLQDLAGRCVGS